MPITVAVKRGSVVYVYDEKGRQLLSISAGHKPEDGLNGYTSTTVSVRRGGVVYTYDEKGRLISSHSTRSATGAAGGSGLSTTPPRGSRAREPSLYTNHHAPWTVCHPDGVPDVSPCVVAAFG